MTDALKFAIGIGAIAAYICIVYLLCKAIWRGRQYKGEKGADE